MGVLVGTALVVIIPEGVETLYSANGASPHAHRPRADLSAAASEQLKAGASPPSHFLHEHPYQSQWLSKRLDLIDDTTNSAAHAIEALPGPIIPELATTDSTFSDPPKTPTDPGKVSILETDTSNHPSSSFPPETHKRTPHAWIGLSLILGFILMYLLDTLPALSPTTNARPQSTNIYSLSDLSSTAPRPSHQHPQRTLSTTLGLCIHAAADGIALGASSSSTATASLSLIIFVAIMVHKAPAAFGLTAVLLKQGLGKRGARAHLVVFSLAAPAGAVATWVAVRALGGGGAEEEGMRWWTGVLLLFSGGTFL